MPVASTSSTAASVAMLRALATSTNALGSSRLKTMISPSRMSPIHVLDPATRRCQKGAGRSRPSSSSSGSSAGAVVTSVMGVTPVMGDGPGHGPDDVLHRHVAAAEARDAGAKAQNLDAVGHLEDLRHVVADEDDRQALVAHAADEVEHVARLDHAERGGRLVHEDDLRRPRHRPRDRDALALAAGHGRDRRRGVLQRDAEVLEGVAALGAHRLLVDEAEPAEQARAHDLAAEEHVGAGIELGREREVLVDGLDPQAARVERRVQLDRLALEDDLAGVGLVHAGQRLDQRRLAGAIVADERDDLVGIDGEARAPQGAHAAEALDDLLGFEQGLGHQAGSFSMAETAGSSSALVNSPAAIPASSAVPRQPASITGGASMAPSRRLACKTAGSRAQPPVTTTFVWGPATSSMWPMRACTSGVTVWIAPRHTATGSASGSRTGGRSSECSSSSSPSAGAAPGAVARAPALSCSRSAPSSSSTSRRASPDHTPASSAWRPSATCQPTVTPACALRRRAAASCGGATRTSASAVPHESSTSPGATTPTPTPATRWSWPATVSTAPSVPGRATPSLCPASVPATTRSASASSGRPAHAMASA